MSRVRKFENHWCNNLLQEVKLLGHLFHRHYAVSGIRFVQIEEVSEPASPAAHFRLESSGGDSGDEDVDTIDASSDQLRSERCNTLMTKSKAELQDMCKALGVHTTGNKDILAGRVADAEMNVLEHSSRESAMFIPEESEILLHAVHTHSANGVCQDRADQRVRLLCSFVSRFAHAKLLSIPAPLVESSGCRHRITECCASG